MEQKSHIAACHRLWECNLMNMSIEPNRTECKATRDREIIERLTQFFSFIVAFTDEPIQAELSPQIEGPSTTVIELKVYN